MADEPVIIVDDHGTEREFPAGFDVQQAIAIVRQSGPHGLETTPGVADTPMSRARVQRPNSDLSQMAASDTANASLAGGRGFVKGAAGVVAHPLNTLGGILQSAAEEGLSTIAGTYHLATAPRDTLRGAGHDIMTKVPEAFNAVAHKASVDPEGFGQDVGAMTANTAAGFALGGATRFVPKPLARGAGGLLDTIGKEAKWPIRMVGAHQLGSGNPMGLVTIALPEQLRKSGEALQRWGTEPGALAGTPEETFLQVQQDLHNAASDPAVASQLSAQLDDLRAKLVTQRQDAKLSADLAGVQKAQNRVDQLSKALKTVTSKASKTVDPTALTEAELTQIRRQVTDPDLQAQVIERFKAQKAGTTPVPTAQATSGAASVARPPIRVTGPMQPPQEAVVALTGPSTPPPPIRIAPETLEKLPTSENPIVGASKSRRGGMSATPGFTVNDLESVGLNPALNYKSLTREVLEALKTARASRSETYRINAGLDQGGSDALLRD